MKMQMIVAVDSDTRGRREGEVGGRDIAHCVPPE